MGGSAISGDITKSYLCSEIRLPVVVNRDYNLPGFVDERTLVFAVSYSGNTEETLSAYNEAKVNRAAIPRIARCFNPGIRAIRTAPTTGRKIIVVR